MYCNGKSYRVIPYHSIKRRNIVYATESYNAFVDKMKQVEMVIYVNRTSVENGTIDHSFQELSLIYNCPQAATAIATGLHRADDVSHFFGTP